MMLIIAQIIGLSAVVLYLLSYQLKKRSHIVWANCVSNALYVLQYILLGAFSGAAMDALCGVGSFFAGKKHSEKLKNYIKWIAVANLVAIAVVGIGISVVQRDPIELLPVAGALLQTGGLWCESEQNIRRLGLCSAPLWLIYNYLTQAYGAAIGSVFIIASAAIALIRFRKSKTLVEGD